MATLKLIASRMKSVSNIRKITKSMKMVSASKYSRAERELKSARELGKGAYHFYLAAKVAVDKEKPQKLYIGITSDKGLCGGMHHNVSRALHSKISTQGPNMKIVAVGEKARAYLQRDVPQYILLSAFNVGRKIPTFIDASKLASATINTKYKYSCGEIIFNKFRNVVSHRTTYFTIFSRETILNTPKVSSYEHEANIFLQSYVEFSLACLLYYAMKENNCVEHSSRMTAMDAAYKNAGDMLRNLNTKYNRSRQASITRELNEIIAGASVV